MAVGWGLAAVKCPTKYQRGNSIWSTEAWACVKMGDQKGGFLFVPHPKKRAHPLRKWPIPAWRQRLPYSTPELPFGSEAYLGSPSDPLKMLDHYPNNGLFLKRHGDSRYVFQGSLVWVYGLTRTGVSGHCEELIRHPPALPLARRNRVLRTSSAGGWVMALLLKEETLHCQLHTARIMHCAGIRLSAAALCILISRVNNGAAQPVSGLQKPGVENWLDFP